MVRELWFNLKCIAQIRRRTGRGGGTRTQTLNKQCVFNYLCVCLVIANATPTRSALRSGRKSLGENETAQPLQLCRCAHSITPGCEGQQSMLKKANFLTRDKTKLRTSNSPLSSCDEAADDLLRMHPITFSKTAVLVVRVAGGTRRYQ